MSGWRVAARVSARQVFAVLAASALLAMGATATAQAAPKSAATPRHPAPPPLPKVAAAKDVGTLQAHPTRTWRPPAQRPVRVSWPAARSEVLDLIAPAPSRSALSPVLRALLDQPDAAGQVSGVRTPLFAQPAGLTDTVTSVRVRVASHATALAAGVRGVVFTARAARGHGGPVRLGIRYASFYRAYGGGYGPALRLVELPACALTTPRRAACQVATPLRSVNDWTARSVSAQVTLPGRGIGGKGGVMVLATTPAQTDGGGADGSYQATSLRASGTWSAGGTSGSFTYSYPFSVPPSPGGLEPALSLDYDSGTVDGQTAATQAQSSWAGEGWTLPQSFIEQSFTACSDDPEGTAAPQSTADECYDGPVLTLSLDGSSVPLVCPKVSFSYTANSTCAPSADNGEVITHHVASGNGQGTKFTDYWTVTTTDGTTYYFGLNHLTGWTSGDATTNSVDSVPVFSAHTGDPCFNTSGTGFTNSVCTMAYRWNLDYVTDLHGNAMAYYYKRDTNAYAETGSTGAVSYVRDSHLDHIDYGFTDGNAFSGHPADEVLFATGDRCFAGAAACDPLSSSTAANWHDVPYYLHCDTGSTTCSTDTGGAGPTFWSTKALTSISTQQWNSASAGYLPVDSWALSDSFPAPGDGTTYALWLNSITRTGQDTTAGGSAVTLNKVSFAPIQEANRVNLGNGPAMDRPRIWKVTTESGSVIQVTYELPDPCTPGAFPPTANNQTSCFPVYWGTFVPGDQGEDWFNKYAVQQVSVSDPYGGSPGLFTSYKYFSPAWHYDDNEIVKPKYRTYGQWRGFQDVQTFSGTGSDPQTETETTYYQGMSDDNDSTDVTVPDSQGSDHEDTDQLAGDVLETTAYGYPGGPVDNSQIYSYWVSAAALTRSRTGLPNLTAKATGQVEAWTRQALTDSSPTTWRETETDTSFYSSTTSGYFGLPEFVYRHGDLGAASQATCATTTYAAVNTSANLVGLPAEVETDAQPCGGSNPGGASMPGTGQVNALTAPTTLSRPADVISDTRTFYDNPTLAATWPQPANPTWPQAAPGNADVSVIRQATGYTASAFTYQTSSAMVYDPFGRVASSYDGNGNLTKTGYTQTGGSTTKTVETNPLSQSVTTNLDPLRGVPVSTVDANGITTTLHYDGLGRLTGVWEYNRAVTTTANLAYTYVVSNSGPTVVTTATLNDSGGTNTSTTLYDSLLRARQTQVPTPQGGMLVSDKFYDSRGWLSQTYTDWWDSGANPGPTVVTEAPTLVPDRSVTQYDGLGRPVIVTSYNGANAVSTKDTAYYGDRATTVLLNDQPATPVVDGTPTSTVTDALNRTTEADQYSTVPTVSTGTNSGGFPTVTITGGTKVATTYTYNHRGWLSDITDATTGEDWNRTYNLLGQVMSESGPNSGTTTLGYDANGNVTSVLNGDSKTISYTYDSLNRKTAQYDGPSTSSPLMATWAYDNSNNAVAGMTDPIGHVTTETSYDASGNAYTIQQAGFNVFGESAGETVTIPATTATGALGTSYTISHTYSSGIGLPNRDTYPASPGGGELPAELVQHGYATSFNLPYSLVSSVAGVSYAYAQSTTYTAFNQVAQEEIGSTTNNAFITSTYDQHTGEITDSQVANTAVSTTPYDDTSYSYDPAENITSETDVRNGTASETQCFSYDTLDRLTAGWTATDSCAAPPSTGAGGNVGDGVTGGAYWTSWTYSPLGDQQMQTQHSVTGGTNTVTNYTYNNGNGTSTGQPDTLTSAVTTGPGAGSSSWTYDAAGNTLHRNLPAGNQTLTWYDDGKLKTDATSAGTTTFIYDADGNLLLQEDPAQTTLYVFGEQLVLITSGTGAGQVTGTRYLPLPGGGTAVRTGGTSSYSFETSDQQGTSELALDSTCQNPVWRQFTPFGAPRGTPTGTWPDTNGFLGKPTGSNTGLTIVGARQYDPVTGRFISVDPVVAGGSQQQLNGYAYAGDNPVTYADPSGMVKCITDGSTCKIYLPPGGGPPATPPSGGGTGGGPGGYTGGSGGGSNGGDCPPTSPGCPGYHTTYYGSLQLSFAPDEIPFAPAGCMHDNISGYGLFCPGSFDPQIVTPPPVLVGYQLGKCTTNVAAGSSCTYHQLFPNPPGPAPVPNTSFWYVHRRGLLQIAIDVVGYGGGAVCVVLTAGACAAALPFIGAGVSVANYALSGGPHTSTGYWNAAGNGAIAGTVAAICTEACGPVIMAAGFTGAASFGVGVNAYLDSPGPHSVGGAFSAGVNYTTSEVPSWIVEYVHSAGQ